MVDDGSGNCLVVLKDSLPEGFISYNSSNFIRRSKLAFLPTVQCSYIKWVHGGLEVFLVEASVPRKASKLKDVPRPYKVSIF